MSNAQRITRPIEYKPDEDDMTKPIEPTKQHEELATYIAQWLEARNGGELREAILGMRVGDYNLMLGELALILANGGRPPNWVA